MKKLLLLTLTVTFFAGCGMLEAKKTEENKPSETKETSKETGKFKVGDTVVAKWSSGSFYEGKVENLDGSKAKIKWLDNSSASDVDMIDIYTIPGAGAKPDVKAGDMVLAKTNTGTYWNGAEVVSVDGDVYKVTPVSSTATMNVPAEKIIKVLPAVAADFKDKAGATDFMKTAQAHRPIPAGDYKPKKGDRVVAEWTQNGWYSGRVESYQEPNVTVAWDDGSKPSPLNGSKVLPMPTSADKDMPKKDQFVLVKPQSGTKWQYAQVTAVNGSTIETKLAGDQKQTVKAGEFILLN